MFQKKIDAVMSWLRNKNKSGSENINTDEYYDPKAEYQEENNMYFEKGDIIAIIISGLIIFVPIIIALIFILKWLV